MMCIIVFLQINGLGLITFGILSSEIWKDFLMYRWSVNKNFFSDTMTERLETRMDVMYWFEKNIAVEKEVWYWYLEHGTMDGYSEC